ncbi:peptidase domain-containing ABC transporter [Bradyrhizobium sp. STM 3557]|uniref:peptidase domain-containing ABC transporter n=1 Tax=Bradyrhizobium sp. STM 3557 TaxID=578920 RepID=UPI00388F29B4
MAAARSSELSWPSNEMRTERSARMNSHEMVAPDSPLAATMQAARYHGIELDEKEFRRSDNVTAAALSEWAQAGGLWSRAVRIRWRNLFRLGETGPVVLVLNDGNAALLTGVDAQRRLVRLKNPCSSEPEVLVDELRLTRVWDGEAVLLRACRERAEDAPFNLSWILKLVLQQRQPLRLMALSSLVISLLTILPPLVVMATVNKVLQFQSVSTLILLALLISTAMVYETLLGYARRLIVAVVSARLDAKLNLHVFNRLVRLPLDYFERHPAGEILYQISQVYRIREFLTGRLLTTLLDLVTLVVLLPFLFYLNAILASIVLACAAAIALIIMTYLKPMRAIYGSVAKAETRKSAALGETIVGIKTVKSLALEPQRSALWDECVAETGSWRIAFSRMANWPQTLVMPLERFMVLGTLLIGASMAISGPSGYLVGTLFAFYMLSQRVAQPLVGLVRLLEDLEEVGAAIGEAALVLNQCPEATAGVVGLRPQFIGEVSFKDVTFSYPNVDRPAVKEMSFAVAPGTTLGIVGRSGSGKSTVTRLLQGINRNYQGRVKIDGVDLRDIDLRHLRRNMGIVLQDNFLFRGSIRENIIAGRPGFTLTDVIEAARLAGAEEFIEQMPGGYETYIEEGSPNLSGGQRQRLAIARALIHKPAILILDEATSALDPESEAIVNANLLRIASGRTMIVVSHRLCSIVQCQQIMVIDDGSVVDVGEHAELLSRCGLYRQLWAQQNRYSESAARGIAVPRVAATGGRA